MLLDLVGKADRLLADSKEHESCKADFFAAILQKGQISYLCMGDIRAAFWNALAVGSEEAKAIRRTIPEYRRRRRIPPKPAVGNGAKAYTFGYQKHAHVHRLGIVSVGRGHPELR